MKNSYRVSGRYLAKYPNGQYTGRTALGTTVMAKSEKKAKKLAASQAMAMYGYVQFQWEQVSIVRQEQQIESDCV